MDRFGLFTILILALTSIPATVAYAEEAGRGQPRTWKTVKDLSPQALREIDLSTPTPRHPTMPYMPAEEYPFTAPYTAEEMGYRLMEFTQRPRWSCAFANVWGSISPIRITRRTVGWNAMWSRRAHAKIGYRIITRRAYSTG